MTPAEIDLELANIIIEALHHQRRRWDAHQTLVRPEELSQTALNVYLAERRLNWDDLKVGG